MKLEPSTGFSKLWLEIVAILSLSCALYFFAIYYDLFEILVDVSRAHEDWELDEIFTLIFLSFFTLSIILTRVLRDLKTEFKRRNLAEEKIRKMAFFDDLTGLPNRALCLNRMDLILAHAQRHKSQVAVLFIDLDNFKVINDSYGHYVGDELLVQIADRLSKNLRKEDTLARISGDEFIVIVDSFEQVQDVTNLAAQILGVIEQPINLRDNEAYVSCSIGIALYPTDGETPVQLIQNADSAMYHAKKIGKNTFEFFSSAIDDQAKLNLQIRNELRKALANNEFFLNYQPIIDTQSGQITGCEALLRWENPTLGTVTPDVFIPIAENSGVILALGDWVLRKACQQNLKWQKEGFAPIVMSVNLSARQLWQEKYADSVDSILRTTGMRPEFLELELTETSIMKDINMATKTLKKLTSLGVSLSLDDFGTGYSSISYLRKLQLDKLKIDRSFIQNIPTNREDNGTLKAILSLAKNLNLSVTAEGVENEHQRDFLKQTQCDSLQGFYFSRPVSAENFAQLLTRQQAEQSDALIHE